MPQHLLSSGYLPQGLLSLRESIARHYCERGLPTRPDEIMVVNGAVSGLALLLRLLTGPGDRVVVDHPTYPLAIAAIQGASCRPVGVSLPEQGWDTAGLMATIAQTAPRMAYLMPDFHNPTGRCMDAAHSASGRGYCRQNAYHAGCGRGRWLICGTTPRRRPRSRITTPTRQLLCWDRQEKVSGAGLRLGWVRASSRTIAALVQTRDTFDLGSPVLEQLATGWLLDNAASFSS
ncbi:GntR family transcriptional regulator [Citrobacter koseri]|uniref:GntR family transcriptional regulator n=1 Tax=Citrobacter koseri TaxID=545 RepID=A0A2X2V4W7_CITKO|nr:GntR family transcriptional regulator [Citrobacter koseri]